MRPEIEEAVQLLQRGDDAALEQALTLLQNAVFSFSMRVCGQREDAEDTMQEVLLKSVPHLPKFDSPKALVVWLHKVAKNRCLMSRRRSKFAHNPDLSLEELMPDRKELEQQVIPITEHFQHFLSEMKESSWGDVYGRTKGSGTGMRCGKRTSGGELFPPRAVP
jgi:DNA-directed RNA polymerase specialized sigma24 family protein